MNNRGQPLLYIIGRRVADRQHYHVKTIALYHKKRSSDHNIKLLNYHTVPILRIKKLVEKVEQEITVASASAKREEVPREEDQRRDIIMIIPDKDQASKIAPSPRHHAYSSGTTSAARMTRAHAQFFISPTLGR